MEPRRRRSFASTVARSRIAQAALAVLALTLGIGVAVAAAGTPLSVMGLPTISVPSVTAPPPPTLPGVGPPTPGKKPPPPSNPGPLPPLGPYVHFARVTYTGSPGADDSKLQVLITQPQYAAKSYVARLRKQNPNIKVLAYQSLWLRPGADPSGETGCLAGKGAYPASWYMFGLSGLREAWHWPSGPVFQMDFSNPAFLKACAQHAIQMAHWIGADGVFFDGVATSVYWEQLGIACSRSHPLGAAARKPKKKTKKHKPRPPVHRASSLCANNTNWQNGMTHALSYLAGRLHSQHLLIFGNISGGNVTWVGGGGPAVWDRYNSVLDGAMEESWAFGTNHRPVNSQRLQTGLTNVAWSEAHHKYTIVNDDITHCGACSGYGMAALLLVGQKLSSYDISNGAYNSYDAWWSQYYDKGQRLGGALGNYYTQSNGLLVRRFADGTVVVNDTTHAIDDPVFGRVNATSAIIH